MLQNINKKKQQLDKAVACAISRHHFGQRQRCFFITTVNATTTDYYLNNTRTRINKVAYRAAAAQASEKRSWETRTEPTMILTQNLPYQTRAIYSATRRFNQYKAKFTVTGVLSRTVLMAPLKLRFLWAMSHDTVVFRWATAVTWEF